MVLQGCQVIMPFRVIGIQPLLGKGTQFQPTNCASWVNTPKIMMVTKGDAGSLRDRPGSCHHFMRLLPGG